jgi:glycosyltransferase involved in cell wall biosynthesis
VLAGDVVHLHWVSKLIDYPSFFASVPDDFPIVWTLHDMNAMTGGCHYTMGCEAFTTECRCCPLLGLPGDNDLSRRSFQVKLAALAGKNLHVVANSQWMESQARRSRVLAGARSFRTIHFGLDTQLFSPQDKRAARRALGLTDDRTIVAFGAESIDNLRKGLGQLLQALSLLRDRGQVLGIVFGNGMVPQHSGLSLPELRSVGFVADPARQATLYSAADVFVIPSLQEAFGQTGIEAMACGTPVVGFDTGGIPDFVRPGETGLLARLGDATDLARQIQWLVDHADQAKRMGRAAREVVLDRFTLAHQARQHIELYESLLTARPATALRRCG